MRILISNLKADRDVMVAAQTGGGKSAAFLIPIIHRLVSEKGKLVNYSI